MRTYAGMFVECTAIIIKLTAAVEVRIMPTREVVTLSEFYDSSSDSENGDTSEWSATVP